MTIDTCTHCLEELDLEAGDTEVCIHGLNPFHFSCCSQHGACSDKELEPGEYVKTTEGETVEVAKVTPGRLGTVVQIKHESGGIGWRYDNQLERV